MYLFCLGRKPKVKGYRRFGGLDRVIFDSARADLPSEKWPMIMRCFCPILIML
jgi:hypothetical protein